MANSPVPTMPSAKMTSANAAPPPPPPPPPVPGLPPQMVSKGERTEMAEQPQLQQFHPRNMALVVEENLGGDRDHADRNDIKQAGPADQKLGGIRHRAEISRDIDGVGD